MPCVGRAGLAATQKTRTHVQACAVHDKLTIQHCSSIEKVWMNLRNHCSLSSVLCCTLLVKTHTHDVSRPHCGGHGVFFFPQAGRAYVAQSVVRSQSYAHELVE